jgi:hypothetical protein
VVLELGQDGARKGGPCGFQPSILARLAEGRLHGEELLANVHSTSFQITVSSSPRPPLTINPYPADHSDHSRARQAAGSTWEQLPKPCAKPVRDPLSEICTLAIECFSPG